MSAYRNYPPFHLSWRKGPVAAFKDTPGRGKGARIRTHEAHKRRVQYLTVHGVIEGWQAWMKTKTLRGFRCVQINRTEAIAIPDADVISKHLPT